MTYYIAIAVYVFSLYLIVMVLIKDVKYGIFYFLPLIPLKFVFIEIHQFPLGNDLIDIMILALLIGWIFSANSIDKTRINKPLSIYSALMLLSLLNGYLYLGGAPSLSDFRLQMWKDYMIMPIIFFIVLNNIRKMADIKKLVFIMSIIFAAVVLSYYNDFSGTSHQHFSEKNRYVSVFGGLGPNFLAAYVVQYMIMFLTLSTFYKKDKKTQYYYLAIAISGFYPILFLYSRGAYIAAAVVLLLLGILKDRRILVACFCLLLVWQAVLPNSVVERVNKTRNSEDQIEEGRLGMWNLAFDTFKSSPLFGTGYRSFESLGLEDAPIVHNRFGREKLLKNAHNIYFQTLAEMGIIGITMLLYLFYLALRSGWQLYITASHNSLKGIGLGFTLCVVCAMITNLFGDRWYLLLIQGYYWMLWALVERGLIITKEEKNSIIPESV